MKDLDILYLFELNLILSNTSEKEGQLLGITNIYNIIYLHLEI